MWEKEEMLVTWLCGKELKAVLVFCSKGLSVHLILYQMMPGFYDPE